MKQRPSTSPVNHRAFFQMKKLLTVLWGTSLALCVRAQISVYHPMPDSNSMWCETATWGITCGVVEHQKLEYGGDTIIGAEQYHEVYATGYLYCNMQYSYFTNDYRGAIRQDMSLKQVYWVDEMQPSEEL